MAEAFAKKRLGRKALVRSAGFDPKPEYDSRSAIRTLKNEFEIDASAHRQTDIRDLDLDSFTHVIAMDAGIGSWLRGHTKRKFITWSIEDPWSADDAEYRRCALQILHELDSLLTRIKTK